MNAVQGTLFDLPLSAHETLRQFHYLGDIDRGEFYWDEAGVMVFSSPTSRRLPSDWLELSRWCITSRAKNAGSQQWSRARRWLKRCPATTLVSYSDPSQGHTGALYRACNWLWAPTWHRIVTPPTGNGSWDGETVQSPKDRWVFPLRRDPRRVSLLRLEPSYLRRFPWAEYKEPGGASFALFKAQQ